MVINVGASAGTVGYSADDFWSSDGCFCIEHLTSMIARYAYYALLCSEKLLRSKVRFAGIPTLDNKVVEDMRIPLPPLPVQHEIVRILDNFTELTAELTARKKQYEYYRNELMTFGDDVEWRTLGECVSKTNNIKWSDNKTQQFQYIDLSSVSRDDNQIYETQCIDSETAPSRAQQIVYTNDVIFGSTRPMLKRYSLITEKYSGQICSTGFCVLRANSNIILPKWLFYNISTEEFYNHIEKHQKGASYPAITDKEVKMHKIPLPPLAVQQRIVEILDRFDTLCNDLSSGLPAEIEARRKQYEYYRDKLLAFKEASV